MANAKWDSATVDEKLEMLRADIKEISDYHNALGRDYRRGDSEDLGRDTGAKRKPSEERRRVTFQPRGARGSLDRFVCLLGMAVAFG